MPLSISFKTLAELDFFAIADQGDMTRVSPVFMLKVRTGPMEDWNAVTPMRT